VEVLHGLARANVKEWANGPHVLLEDAEIQHEVYTKMKKYVHASCLKKTPGHKTKEMNIHLWKQYSKQYYNKEDW
jgi:hypothetical protein